MDELVSSGRIVLKARYSIYLIQLCCVGQTGLDSKARAEGTLQLPTKWRASSTQSTLVCTSYSTSVGQTCQDSRALAEGTLRLPTKWRASSTQSTSACTSYSSAVGQTGQDSGVRAEGMLRLPAKWRSYGTQSTTARVSPIGYSFRVSPPHDCVRMGLIEYRVFDTRHHLTKETH